MKSSLLITTCNSPYALELGLKSVLFQSHLVNEILLADNGSRSETKRLIQKSKE